MKLEVNLNETVEVVLTKEGAAVYNRRWDDKPWMANFTPNKLNEGDTLRTQIWCLMQDFGPSINIGMKPLFEGLIMTINIGVS